MPKKLFTWRLDPQYFHLRWFLVLIVITLPYGCNSYKRSSNLVSKAEDHIWNEEFSEAKPLLDKALKIYDSEIYTTPYLLKGIVFGLEGEYDSCISFMHKALSNQKRAFSDNFYYMEEITFYSHLLGVVYFCQNDIENAIGEFKNSAQYNPIHTFQWIDAFGKKCDCIEDIKFHLDFTSLYKETSAYLINCYKKEGRYYDALYAATTYNAFEENDPFGYEQMAHCFQLLGDSISAIKIQESFTDYRQDQEDFLNSDNPFADLLRIEKEGREFWNMDSIDQANYELDKSIWSYGLLSKLKEKGGK